MNIKSLHRASIISVIFISLGSTVALAKPTVESYQESRQIMTQTQTNSPSRKRRRGGLIKDLNLTSEQRQQIKQIRQQSKNKIRQKRQAMRQARNKLEELIASEASEGQVRSQYNQLKKLRQELADMQFENTFAIRDVLTLEQRQKFVQRMQQRRQRRK